MQEFEEIECFERHGWFRKWREDVQDGPRRGKPTTQRTTVTNAELVSSVRRKPPKSDMAIGFSTMTAPVYEALRLREFLAKKSTAEMDNQPY